jgi:hypothetical protein
MDTTRLGISSIIGGLFAIAVAPEIAIPVFISGAATGGAIDLWFQSSSPVGDAVTTDPIVNGTNELVLAGLAVASLYLSYKLITKKA